MNTNLKYKWLVIAAVLLACVYLIIGIPKSMDELKANVAKNIRLGLDLKGGSHLVAQIQVQDAFKLEADTITERLKEGMAKQGITFQGATRNDPQTLADAGKIEIDFKGVPLDKTAAFRSLVSEIAPDWVLAASGADYNLTMKPSAALALSKDTVERAVQTISKRVDGLGVAEATVVPRGRADAEAEVMIQMPGVDDPARIKSLLSTAAKLELCEVKGGPFSSEAEARASNNGILPLGTRVTKPGGGRAGAETGVYIVSRTPVITGRDLKNARASRGDVGQWETAFTLSQEAGRRFGRFTEANIGNRLAIVLDDKVISAPSINGRIEDSGVIQGVGAEQDAADLALILRSGSLPAGLNYLQETTVGPSLGADSIREGFVAGVVGLLAVIAVMLVYYKGSGVNAVLALILNAVILIAAVSYFEATLTLPGIAGIILTIGMAVDSNVLIFERIREELNGGKSVPAAIEAGFGRAFLTIIDTHVTTVVSCAFLFLFGSGPVKGFAVTLVIGLLANVFTAVFVSRAIFDWNLSRNPQMQTLSI